jgi:peptide/nickel transport system substrate-binding protein
MKSRARQSLSQKRLSRRDVLKAGAAGLGAGAVVLAGCGGDDGGGNGTSPTPVAEGTPQYGGDMVLGLTSDPGMLDSQECVTCYWVASAFNGFLYHIHLQTQDMLMNMAASFEQPDTTTYIWQIHPGIKFHDIDPTFGREVTAEDVVYSYQRRHDASQTISNYCGTSRRMGGA